jgi:ribosomal-protein-alanine N-acetyltransferase
LAVYLGGAKAKTCEFNEARMKFYLETWEKYGFGFCLMIWKPTGEEIGWSGLQPLENSGEIEVGYGLKKDFWGKGIGFETAHGWLKYGFETANLDRIVAVASQENTGSWRIMEKCGMKFEGMRFHYGMDLVFYAISRDEWENLNFN